MAKEIFVPIWEKYSLTIEEAAAYFRICFLQALFGQNCKIFLDIVASPFWTKLQSTG